MNIPPCWEFCHRCENFIDHQEDVDCSLRPIPECQIGEELHPCAKFKWRRRTKEELESLVKLVRQEGMEIDLEKVGPELL